MAKVAKRSRRRREKKNIVNGAAHINLRLIIPLLL